MKTIHAVFEAGVFRPLGPVDLPERCEVEFAPVIVGDLQPKPGSMDGIYAVMSERYESGEHDVAARHNEHQP